MKKSGLADSPLFHAHPPGENVTASPLSEPSDAHSQQAGPKPKDITPPKDSEPNSSPLADQSETKLKTRTMKKPRHRDTTIPRYHDTMASRYHDTIVEVIRKAVREFGKEAATHRFTAEEKKAIADIIYSYKRRGIRTSENEVARIAVNFIVGDYKENGENSVLHRALEALNT